jgi:hypothetical protein
VIVHDHAETPSTITVKWASTIAEMRSTSLLVLENNRLRKLLRDEIREWRWQLEEPRLWRKPNGTIDITHQIDNDIEIRRVTTTNGFYVVTNDPTQPEILFRTNDEAACKRWATVLNNIFEGRLQID